MQVAGLTDMSTDEDIRIKLAQEYIARLQQGDESASRDVLLEICQVSGSAEAGVSGDIYAEVGKLTREMHESINSFANDTRMQSMMSEDMPDARQRLNHVIETTENSAHQTMAAVEASTPLLAKLTERSVEIQKLLETYFSRCDASNGLKLIQEELTDFMSLVACDTSKVNAAMNNIMLAQGYQDLTGQVIQRVITLVQEVEDGLISILKIGSEQSPGTASAEQAKEADRKGHGPAVPGVTGDEVMQDQDDVDDLLSSLGF